MKTLKLLILISIALIGMEANAQDNKEQRSEEFRLIDTDGNKIIEKSEMIAFYKDKTDKQGNRIIHGIVLFADLDANNDNIVTLEEFFEGSVSKEEKTGVADSSKKPKPKKLSSKKVNPKNEESKTLTVKQKKKERFHIMDSDGNKVITLEEMVIFYKGKTNKKGEQVESETMFFGLDKNKNNEITLNEFLKKVDWKLGKQRFKLLKNSTD